MQPFSEEQPVARNKYWGDYGVNEYEAEQYLLDNVPQAYIIRPPCLYGPMNNIYSEAFMFECALSGRPFYVPGDGDMKLQFYYIDDLCDFMDVLLLRRPHERIFNVGNKETVTVKDWVNMCYQAAGRQAQLIKVKKSYNQRDYFCYYDYGYFLDVSKHNAIMRTNTSLQEGIIASIKYSDEIF